MTVTFLARAGEVQRAHCLLQKGQVAEPSSLILLAVELSVNNVNNDHYLRERPAV